MLLLPQGTFTLGSFFHKKLTSLGMVLLPEGTFELGTFFSEEANFSRHGFNAKGTFTLSPFLVRTVLLSWLWLENSDRLLLVDCLSRRIGNRIRSTCTLKGGDSEERKESGRRSNKWIPTREISLIILKEDPYCWSFKEDQLWEREHLTTLQNCL